MSAVGFGPDFNFFLSLVGIILSIAMPVTIIATKHKRSDLMMFIGLCGALIALLFQFYDFAQVMVDQDVGLIFDVYVFMPRIYAYYVILIIALNIGGIRKKS